MMEKEAAKRLYQEVMKYSNDEKTIRLYKEYQNREHTKDLLHQGMGMRKIMEETGLSKEEIQKIAEEMRQELMAYINDEWF